MDITQKKFIDYLLSFMEDWEYKWYWHNDSPADGWTPSVWMMEFKRMEEAIVKGDLERYTSHTDGRDMLNVVLKENRIWASNSMTDSTEIKVNHPFNVKK